MCSKEGVECGVRSSATEGAWAEYAFPMTKRGRQTVELRPEVGALTVFHYWFSRAI